MRVNSSKEFWINTGILIVILVLVNTIALSLFHRFDLTEGHIYSISKATKSVLSNLQDRVLVKVYFSKTLPPQYANTRRFLKDILDEYQAYGHGKFHYEFYNPENSEELKKEAQKNRIPPLRSQVYEKDKFVSKVVYMGMVFLYQGQKEVIPVIENTQGMEYDITTTIKRLSSQELVKIAFLKGHNELDRLKSSREMLEKYYQVQDLTIIEGETIPYDIETLIIAGVKDSLSDWDLFAIDDYIMNGGNVIVFQDRIDADLQNIRTNNIKTNLYDILSHYGVKINNDLLIDAQNNPIQVQQMQGFFRMVSTVAYPLFPKITNLNKNNLITKNIGELSLFFASTLDTTGLGKDKHFEVLFSSSKQSGTMRGRSMNINPFQNEEIKKFDDKQYILGGILTGKLTSYFADNEKFSDRIVHKETQNSRLLIVGDADLIDDKGGGGIESNQNFFLNSIDYMTQDQGFISLRSRAASSRPLKEVSAGLRKTIKWINVLLPALLSIVLGLIIFQINTNRRKVVKAIYE
ncbi:MAG: hypothetical protein DRH57_08985 [Candidatus Cloacimonadota bacterium]|nr:MAG: hypothetical protein DRH57_08985 [Candidatus Cloacimonadota bacterium]